jgi:hypothetical protein
MGERALKVKAVFLGYGNRIVRHELTLKVVNVHNYRIAGLQTGYAAPDNELIGG